MAAPTIPNLPTAPAPTDSPGTFNSRAFAWVAALTGWTTAVNALADWMNANVPNEDTPEIPGGSVQYDDTIIVFRDGVAYSIPFGQAFGGTTVETITNDNYFLLADDRGKYMRFTETSLITCGALEASLVGSSWCIKNVTGGNITLVAADGYDVDINPPAGGTLVIPNNGVANLMLVYSNAGSYVYDLMGQVVPA